MPTNKGIPPEEYPDTLTADIEKQVWNALTTYGPGKGGGGGIPQPGKTMPKPDSPTGSVGGSDDYARADHSHPEHILPGNEIPLAGSIQGSAGSSDNYAREDHQHPTPEIPVAASAAPKDLATQASVGTSSKFAREDHAHKLPDIPKAATTIPQSVGTTPLIGTSTSYAREDHAHAIDDSGYVKTTGNQTIDGLKTFTTTPIIPTVTGVSGHDLDGVLGTISPANDSAPAANINMVNAAVAAGMEQVKEEMPKASIVLPQEATGTGDIGASNDYARADHAHPMQKVEVPQPSSEMPARPTTGGDIGASADYARADHSHPEQEIHVPEAAFETPQTPVEGGNVGVSENYARADHRHPLQMVEVPEAGDDIPLPPSETPMAGISQRYAREDHVHPQQEVPEASTLVPRESSGDGVIGDSTQYARADHQHPVTDAPQPATELPARPTVDGEVGSSTDYARADHSHPEQQIDVPHPSADVPMPPSDWGEVGTSEEYARADHRHPMGEVPQPSVLMPRPVDDHGWQGDMMEYARADHVHEGAKPRKVASGEVVFHISETGNDDLDGLTWETAVETLQGLVRRVGEWDFAHNSVRVQFSGAIHYTNFSLKGDVFYSASTVSFEGDKGPIPGVIDASDIADGQLAVRGFEVPVDFTGFTMTHLGMAVYGCVSFTLSNVAFMFGDAQVDNVFYARDSYVSVKDNIVVDAMAQLNAVFGVSCGGTIAISAGITVTLSTTLAYALFNATYGGVIQVAAASAFALNLPETVKMARAVRNSSCYITGSKATELEAAGCKGAEVDTSSSILLGGNYTHEHAISQISSGAVYEVLVPGSSGAVNVAKEISLASYNIDRVIDISGVIWGKDSQSYPLNVRLWDDYFNMTIADATRLRVWTNYDQCANSQFYAIIKYTKKVTA